MAGAARLRGNQYFLQGAWTPSSLRFLPAWLEDSLRASHGAGDYWPSGSLRGVFDAAAACEILEQVDVKKFREAAVLGDGKLAQLIARVLRTEIPRVVMYGKHEKKFVIARRAGIAAKRVRGDAGDLKRIQEKFPLVVEATGSPTGLTLALQMTEPRGTLVLKSTFHGAVPVETWPIVVKEISVVGSRCGPFARAIGLLRSGEIDPTPLITQTFPLSDTPSAMAFAQKPGVMKVLLNSQEL